MSIIEATTGMVFDVRASMCINPATVDATEVRRAQIFTAAGDPIVVIEWSGLHMQTYECSPLAVADAFERLAERIRAAVQS